MMTSREYITRVQRARRHVEKCGNGFKLKKVRGHGFMVVHSETSSMVLNEAFGGSSLALEEVEEFAGIRTDTSQRQEDEPEGHG